MIDDGVLEQVAAQLAARVREDDPETNGEWLAGQIPDDTDPAVFYRALAVVLAAAVPTECPHCRRELTWRQLTAWWRYGDTAQVVARRRLVLAGGDPDVVAVVVAGQEPGRALTYAERVAVVVALHVNGYDPAQIATRAQCSRPTVRRILRSLNSAAA